MGNIISLCNYLAQSKPTVSARVLLDDVRSGNEFIYTDGLMTVYIPALEHAAICSRCLAARIYASGFAPERGAAEALPQEQFADLRATYRSMIGSVRHARSFGIACLQVSIDKRPQIYYIMPLPTCKACLRYFTTPFERQQGAWLSKLQSEAGCPGAFIQAWDVRRLVIGTTEFPIFISRVKLSDPYGSDFTVSSGKGWSSHSALASGFGEAMEHYAFDVHLHHIVDDSDVSNNSGWAAADCVETARCRARLEIIERDAFLVSWANGFASPIDEGLCRSAEMVLAMDCCNAAGYSVSLLEMARSGTNPVVLCLLWHANVKCDLPYSVCGLGCGIDTQDAAERSLLEAVQMIPAYQFHGDRNKNIGIASHPSNPSDHAAYYATKLRRSELSWLLFPRGTRGWSCDSVGDFDDIELHCVTPADLSMLGLFVYRATSDRLVPLFFGQPKPTDFGRLRTRSEKVFGRGLECRSVSSLGIHPFC